MKYEPVEPVEILTVAGDRETGFFNTETELGHEDRMTWALAEVVYFRKHVLEASDIPTYLAPGGFKTRLATYELVLERFVGFQYDFQSSIMASYLDGVTKTVATLDGLESFANSSKNDRLGLWAHIFDMNPLATALAVNKVPAPGVPFADIYSSRGPVHLKWRTFIKTTFCFFCDDTFEVRVRKTDKKSRETCYDRWRALPRTPVFDTLDLGTLLDVPVKPGGPLDQGRRKRVKKVEYDDAHVLMVSWYLLAVADNSDLV